VDFGIMTQAKVDDVGLARFAEQLGYAAYVVMDSQLIWSDPYACLALAADRTTAIEIGTIAVIGTRLAPVTAAAIATINRLAPGRTLLALATGHTAWRMMGQPPRGLALLEETIGVVRGLTTGLTVPFRHEGREAPVRLDMAELGFVDTSHPVSIQVAATGPRATELAGRLADGVVDPTAADPARIRQVRTALAESGAGRPTTISAPLHVILLDRGEDPASDRVVAEAGPTVMLVLHEIYAGLLARQAADGPPMVMADQLPPPVRAVWKDYCALVDRMPDETRNLRLHAGHATYVHPDEWRFVTPGLVAMTTLTGEQGDVIDKLRELDDAGLDRVYLASAPAFSYASAERFARLILSRW